MRLPQDRSNWTLRHAEKALKAAHDAFDKYERLYDADNEKRTNELYGEYMRAVGEARDVIIVTNSRHLLKELDCV